MRKFTGIFFATMLMVIFFANDQGYARSVDEIKKSGSIRIGIRDNIPPLQYRDKGGQLIGIDPDLGKMLANSLGVKPEWKILASPKDREELLVKQEVDVVISSYSITKERLEVVDFSNPYFTTGLGLMIRAKDKDKIKSYRDLSRKTVTSTRGSTGEKLISELVPDAALYIVSATQDTYDALKNGKADALINDKVFLDNYAGQHQELFVLEGTLSADQYGIGICKSDKELLNYVNTFLDNIKSSGKLSQVIGTYFVKEERIVDAEEIKASGTIANHTIQLGDTLSRMALKYYQDPAKWPMIYAANKDIIKYANVLEVGWTIKIPSLSKTPAANPQSGTIDDKLKELKRLLQNGTIDKKTFEEMKKELLMKHLMVN